MTERFIERVPLKWNFEAVIGYADLFKMDDGSIKAKACITDTTTYDEIKKYLKDASSSIGFSAIVEKEGEK